MMLPASLHMPSFSSPMLSKIGAFIHFHRSNGNFCLTRWCFLHPILPHTPHLRCSYCVICIHSTEVVLFMGSLLLKANVSSRPFVLREFSSWSFCAQVTGSPCPSMGRCPWLHSLCPWNPSVHIYLSQSVGAWDCFVFLSPILLYAGNF